MRIEGASDAKLGRFTRLLLWIGRRETTKLTGRKTTTRMIEPAQAYATTPGLLVGYGIFEGAVARAHRVDERLKVLAELKAAALTQCEWCIDIGSPIAYRAGVSEAQLLALAHYSDSDEFNELEKLVLDLAVGVSSTPVSVSDELFSALREHLDDAQLVELTNVIALENMRGRFNLALGIGSAGFSEGMVCVVPETVPAAA
ncbi:MAG TPA: carboxymuconolactone decarboxylase family protein [Solirubrobacteraceae bacterium]|jgi:4-carboxymuconolactone decarboxylase|nr:carboxymuconolactone decarboxylase family protein [Solirubrobacteraceae bacterium]